MSGRAICWLPQIKEMQCQLFTSAVQQDCHDRNGVAHTTVDARDVKRGIQERRGRCAAHLLAAAAALSRHGAIYRPCLVHVLGCGIFEIDFGNLGRVTGGRFFCVLASSAGWGGSGQWWVLIVDWWSTFVER